MTELDNNKVITEGMELSLVETGIGGAFVNTNELKVMNYREAMQSLDGLHGKTRSRMNWRGSKHSMPLLWCHAVNYKGMQKLCLQLCQ
jgi:hypothetical protein